MDALLVAIAVWISANTDLPATHDPPAVRFASPVEITALRYGQNRNTRTTASNTRTPSPADTARSVVAIYDDRHGVIVLPIGWTGETAADLSVLVHEMVHHFQAVAGLRYACTAAREKVAYDTQEKWLALFNTSLEREFDIDALTLLAHNALRTLTVAGIMCRRAPKSCEPRASAPLPVAISARRSDAG